jgi:hypothetical protein
LHFPNLFQLSAHYPNLVQVSFQLFHFPNFNRLSTQLPAHFPNFVQLSTQISHFPNFNRLSTELFAHFPNLVQLFTQLFHFPKLVQLSSLFVNLNQKQFTLTLILKLISTLSLLPFFYQLMIHPSFQQ